MRRGSRRARYGIARRRSRFPIELPCGALTLRWTPQGVTLEAEGGTVTMGTETEVASDGAPLLLVPSRVLISPELDEVDWIASLLMHRNDAARILELMIHDPS
jgi:hypothetical protein